MATDVGPSRLLRMYHPYGPWYAYNTYSWPSQTLFCAMIKAILIITKVTIGYIAFLHPGISESGKVAWTASWTKDSSAYSCTPRVATHPILPARLCGSSNGNSGTPDKGCLGPFGAKSSVCKVNLLYLT